MLFPIIKIVSFHRKLIIFNNISSLKVSSGCGTEIAYYFSRELSKTNPFRGFQSETPGAKR